MQSRSSFLKLKNGLETLDEFESTKTFDTSKTEIEILQIHFDMFILKILKMNIVALSIVS